MVFAAAGSGAAAERSPPTSRLALDGLRGCSDGGVVLPGSDTCLRLEGAVQAEASVRTGRPSKGADARHSLTHLGTTARVALDARTPTAMGPVRVYLSVRARRAEDGSGR